MWLEGVDAYYIPSGDYHASEYFPEYFRTCSFLSGFTGEAAEMVVTNDGAWLWTDGRFFLQAEKELEGSGITLMKSGEEGVPTVIEFLKKDAEEYLASHSDEYYVGLDGKVVPMKFGKELLEELDEISSRIDRWDEELQCHVASADIKWEEDLAGRVWKDRPAFRTGSVRRLPLSSAGVSAADKLKDMRAAMKDAGADCLLLTDLMEIAWLLNLRGSDVLHTPVFCSFVLLEQDRIRIYLPDTAKKEDLPDPFEGACGYEIKDYEDIYEDVRGLPSGSALMLDPATANFAICSNIMKGVKVIEGLTPVAAAKVIKNGTEIACEKDAHIKDAAAVIRTIRWVRDAVKNETLRETDVSDRVKKERFAQEGCFDLSFETIAGYGPNGAIIHYTPQRGSDAELRPEGFLLLDSGGQYADGTTDITRTIALGPLSDQMIRDYTLVLKGHVAFSRFRVTPDMDGTEIDAESRKALREHGLDFNHGVSHGVGHVLAVHEGPSSVGRKKPAAVRMKPGMIMSNEPGVYRAGEYGVRIENMVLAKDAGDGSGDVITEPLTLVPYEREAIDVSLLTDDELAWINDYHERVLETVGPLLSGADRDFLEKAAAPIVRE